MSVLDTMKAASAARRQVTLCLDGALQAEHDELQKALVQASFDDKDSLARENTTAAYERLEKVRERMAASEVAFTFERLPWAKRLELQANHPPRDGNLFDREQQANIETYMPALIRASCASVKGADGVEVTDIPDDVWDTLLGQLQLNQVETLFFAAKNANDMATTVPISARAWLNPQDLGASSKPPGPGTSARNGSKGGNRRGSQSSTTTPKAASSGT